MTAMITSTTAPNDTRQVAMLIGPKSVNASAMKMNAPPHIAPTKNSLATSNRVGRLIGFNIGAV
jgi:hypothetical protein